MKKSEKRPAMLSDTEYATMMREFESASNWMAEQLAAKRGNPRSIKHRRAPDQT